MKKSLIFTLIAVFAFAFSSCDDDDDDAPAGGAKVFVTLKNTFGVLQENETVYMFKDYDVNDDTTPDDAYKKAVTNENGVAEFDLNFVQFGITESKTTLTFVYFYTNDDGDVLFKSSENITVKRDDVKRIELQIPI